MRCERGKVMPLRLCWWLVPLLALAHTLTHPELSNSSPLLLHRCLVVVYGVVYANVAAV